MRFNPTMFDAIDSGVFTGDNKPNGRVTIEPGWQLKKTPPVYANRRGPYRYYRSVETGGTTEYELPNITNISIDRSDSQDIATCNITMRNMWHEGNFQAPELAGQLGKPGFFWPKRGKGDSDAVWNQAPGKGAYRRDGTWDSTFDWTDVIVPHALIVTRQGYGGGPTRSNYVSIDDDIANNKIVMTGVWLIDTVDGGSDGSLSIQCRDIGRILLDQIVFPPLIPSGLYPLEYYPAGKTAFDSMWGPSAKSGVSPASRGEAYIKFRQGSGDSDPSRSGYPGTNALAGTGTVGTLDRPALTEAYAAPDGGIPWFEFDIEPHASGGVSSFSMRPWAGGYEMFIHIMVGSTWQGSSSVGGVPYVKKMFVPQYASDNSEVEFNVDLPATYNATRIRFSFKHLYYSGVPDGSGKQYRAGIRDVAVYRQGANVSPYNIDVNSLPFTYSMAAHPTRGYWVLDDSGNVYGFGDASYYDSSTFGPVPIGSHTGLGGPNKAAAMAAHPDGKGYWVMDWMGHIWAYGSASKKPLGGVTGQPTEVTVPWPTTSTVPFHPGGIAAMDMAVTATGNGYWVIFSNGVIYAFGDASSAFGKRTQLPQTAVGVYMSNTAWPAYPWTRRGTSIAGHPSKIGCWATNGSGEVWAFGASQHFGQLKNRVYNKGMAGQFQLAPLEYNKSITPTRTGRGYWITSYSGRIAAFGDAANQGPANVSRDLGNDTYTNSVVAEDGAYSSYIFRSLVWDLAADPDGSGFWVLVADGRVLHYNADFWGQPGWQGKTGYKWHEGNWNGEFSDVVRDILRWSGFTLYTSALDSVTDSEPLVFGSIEDTGIRTDTVISGERFDKKTALDVIKELADVVGYEFNIAEDGSANFRSPAIWSAGNIDENGDKIYVKYNTDGSYERVESTDPDAEIFIPIIRDDRNMFNYHATLSGADDRTEIIIGTDLPDPKDPTRTGYVRHVPPVAKEKRNGIPLMRGIERPALWISSLFSNSEEAELMAELTGLRAWFGQRAGSVDVIANPLLSINDQVRLLERNTSETFINRITSIKSDMDLQSGKWSMSLQVHWLGDADNWVISNAPQPDSPYPYVVISERLNSWQTLMNRGLNQGGSGSSSVSRFVLWHGVFSSTVAGVGDFPRLGIDSRASGDSGSGDIDDTNALGMSLYGNGIKWSLDNGDPSNEDEGLSLSSIYFHAMENDLAPVMYLGLCPPFYKESGSSKPDSSKYADLAAAYVEILEAYDPAAVVVWKGMTDFANISDYLTFYNVVYSAIKTVRPNLPVFGPDCLAASTSNVSSFISGATGYDGIAVHGSYTDSQWKTHIDALKAITDVPIIATMDTASAEPALLYDALGVSDTLLWPSGTPFDSPVDHEYAEGSWSFEGELILNTRLDDGTLFTEIKSAPLGGAAYIEIYNSSGSLIINTPIGNAGETVSLPAFGTDGVRSEFTFKVKGSTASTGSGQLKLILSGSKIDRTSVYGSIVVAE